MGLAIIIILVSLIVLFVVTMVARREPTEIKKTYEHKLLASNTAYAMLALTTDCGDRSLRALLVDCARGPYILDCPTGDSCEYAKDVIGLLLEETLEEWNKEYYFTADMPYGGQIEFGEECAGEKVSSIPCCRLPVGGGEDVVVNLDICG